MSIEDLLNVKVTSVSKSEQKLSETAAAIYVITQEDIQRSGATNIPDLLRMVPGMDVGQINANTWAISARGFNRRYADELMVLLDGRSIYLPTFGGVFWDVLDVPLADIERIEVIRGAGASIWGRNAVNGVVNIITKAAGKTEGGRIEAGAGNLQPGFGTVQYGARVGGETDYRVYAQTSNVNELPSARAPEQGDGWHILHGGFRVDSDISRKDSLTFQGDLYTGREDQGAKIFPSFTSSVQLIEMGIDLSGGSFQVVWKHDFSARSTSTVSASYDRYQRDNILDEREGVLNVQFQHQYRWKERHKVVWGLNVSDAAVMTDASLPVSFSPPKASVRLYAGFAQDEIAIEPNRFYLTLGTQLEQAYSSGFDVMPTIRGAWKIGEHRTLWGAISRAVNTTDLNKTAMRLNFTGFSNSSGTLFIPALIGNPQLRSEQSLDYELGYRSTPTKNTSLDIATYYDQYSHLDSREPAAPFFESQPAPAHVVLPTMYENLLGGETYGAEAFGSWKVADRLTLSPGDAFEKIRMRLAAGSKDSTSVAQMSGSSPVNSAQFRSHLILPHQTAWDLTAYFVGRIADPAVPSYTRLDSGVTWQAGERLSFALFGQNLLRNERLEYIDTLGSTQSTLVKRGGYAKVIWKF